MQRGALKPEDLQRITKNTVYLQDNLDAEVLCPLSIEKGLITDNDKLEIFEEPRKDLKADKYLDKVKNSGHSGYDKFLQVLDYYGYGFVVEKLNQTTIDEQEASPFAWIEDLDERVKQHVLTSRDACKLSLCLGAGWERVMLELGLRQSEIENEMSRSHQNSICILNLLQKWQQKESKKATILRVLIALKEYNGHVTVEWDKVKQHITEI